MVNETGLYLLSKEDFHNTSFLCNFFLIVVFRTYFCYIYLAKNDVTKQKDLSGFYRHMLFGGENKTKIKTEDKKDQSDIKQETDKNNGYES